MANILTHPTNGAIYFDDGTAGSSSVPALTGDAVSLNYDGSAGLNITSYNTTSTDRFSIDGDSGRLFSVNDSLTGTIFSVNDAAGLPIIEVESTSTTDTITMGTYASNALVVAGDRVGIGTASPGSSYKLDVTGDVNINGDIVLGGKLDFSGNITAATSDTDVFVVIDAGELKTRTGAQVASDIGLGNVTNESKATMFSSPSFTGTPIAPTASANTNTTQIATTEYVQTEIGELIGGAPAALDTLNELAAAIGDDASYASSITTALAAKAPLASPNFTGDVDVAGSITTEGPDGGMVMRSWQLGGSYGMIGTANMTGSEYSLLTDGTNTYISGGAGGNVYIRGGDNDSSPQITVSGGNIGLAGVPSKASEATAIVWDGTNIGYRELGSAAFSATSAFAPATGSTSIVSLGTVVTGDWNAGVISSTYLDADTAHLSGTQTFSGAKTFSSGLNISVSTSNTQLKLKRTGTATGEFNIYTNNDSLFFNNVGQSSYPMAIDEDGNVGIGTTSPSHKLEVGLTSTVALANQPAEPLHVSNNGQSVDGRVFISVKHDVVNTASAVGAGFKMTAAAVTSGTASYDDSLIYLESAGPGNDTIHSAPKAIKFYVDNHDTNAGSGANYADLGDLALTIAEDTNATFAGSVTATSLIKSGGSSAEFLKADGSVDSSTYLTTGSASSTYAPLASPSFTGDVVITDDTFPFIRSSTNGLGAGIKFSDHTTGYTQNGTLTFLHGNGSSYGSEASFTLSTSEASTTILADGKLMYGEGIYSKPATGTGAGTRKDTNWDTAYGWGNHASAGYVTTDNNTFRTVTAGGNTLGSGEILALTAGSNVTITESGGAVTITAANDNTQLSTAQVRSKISGTGLISYNTSTGVISTTANNYSLPEATATVRGGIELFSNTDQSVAANSVSSTSGRTYGIQLNSAGQAVVNVPWSDNNTVYTHPTHAGDDISIDTGALTGATIISDLDFNITTDTSGHVTDANGTASTRTLTLADLGYTGATNANNYSHPTHAGDDISIDTGALTGATVISDLDFNITTNTSGHVTDANGTVATRTLTAANLGISAPNAPASASAAIVGNTVEVTFAESTTSDIDSYLVYSSIDGSDYGLISIVPPDDFAASMSIIDNAFDETGTQAYRVYAMKYGILSSATTASVSYTVSSAEPTTMSVINLNNAYYVQWNPPSSNARFVTAYNVYKHEHATQGSLSRSSASLIYSGINTNYMYQISGSNNNNFHQFWVETTIA